MPSLGAPTFQLAEHRPAAATAGCARSGRANFPIGRAPPSSAVQRRGKSLGAPTCQLAERRPAAATTGCARSGRANFPVGRAPPSGAAQRRDWVCQVWARQLSSWQSTAQQRLRLGMPSLGAPTFQLAEHRPAAAKTGHAKSGRANFPVGRAPPSSAAQRRGWVCQVWARQLSNWQSTAQPRLRLGMPSLGAPTFQLAERRPAAATGFRSQNTQYLSGTKV